MGALRTKLCIICKTIGMEFHCHCVFNGALKIALSILYTDRQHHRGDRNSKE